MIGFGQSWKHWSGGNAFDGNSRVSYVVGSGSDSPYNEPTMSISFSEKSEKISFSISGAGYYPDWIMVLFSFDNEEGNVYQSNSITPSYDNNTLSFGSEFSLIDNTIVYEYKDSPRKKIATIDRIEIFKKLMDASFVNFKIMNKPNVNYIKFSLSGSTKAIKNTIPKIDELYEQISLAKRDTTE